MFGLGQVKQHVATLQQNVTQLFDRVHGQKVTVGALSKTVGELQVTVSALRGKSDAAVTPQRADELAVAISKCSADLAELDRRICALENAANAKAAPTWEGALRVTEPQQKLPVTRNRGNTNKRRVQARNRANMVLHTDSDARQICDYAFMKGIDERIVKACLAAGVIDFVRKGKASDLTITTTHHMENTTSKFVVAIIADNKHTAGYSDEKTRDQMYNHAHSFVQIATDYFAGMRGRK
jgi:hypothetical protein